MSDVPLHEAHPALSVDLEPGEHVTAVVAFLIIEDAESHAQQVQMAATEGMAGVMLRGLVEIGREILIADQQGEP